MLWPILLWCLLLQQDKVKLYQGVVGGILLCILPISYVVLKFGGNPASVFIVHLCVCIIAFIARLYIIRSMIGLVLSDYVKKVVLLCACCGHNFSDYSIDC